LAQAPTTPTFTVITWATALTSQQKGSERCQQPNRTKQFRGFKHNRSLWKITITVVGRTHPISQTDVPLAAALFEQAQTETAISFTFTSKTKAAC
jgi:hypothetical protein